MASGEIIGYCWQCGEPVWGNKGAAMIKNLKYKGSMAWFHLDCYIEYKNKEKEEM